MTGNDGIGALGKLCSIRLSYRAALQNQRVSRDILKPVISRSQIGLKERPRALDLPALDATAATRRQQRRSQAIFATAAAKGLRGSGPAIELTPFQLGRGANLRNKVS